MVSAQDPVSYLLGIVEPIGSYWYDSVPEFDAALQSFQVLHFELINDTSFCHTCQGFSIWRWPRESVVCVHHKAPLCERIASQDGFRCGKCRTVCKFAPARLPGARGSSCSSLTVQAPARARIARLVPLSGSNDLLKQSFTARVLHSRCFVRSYSLPCLSFWASDNRTPLFSSSGPRPVGLLFLSIRR